MPRLINSHKKFLYNLKSYVICYLVRHEAAKEMRAGPSKPACRSRLQTTLRCSG